MLYATGLTDDDMAKPQIGISSVWYEGKSLLHLPARNYPAFSQAGIAMPVLYFMERPCRSIIR